MEYTFTTDNFDTEVLGSDIPVLVDFYADWCGPCKMMGPVIDQIANEYEGKVKVGKLNVDNDPEIAQRYRVMSIPTFLFVKGGEAIGTSIGAIDKATLESKIKEMIG